MSEAISIESDATGQLRVSQLTEVYVVRHAEVHNPRDILYGRLPRFGLSETGNAQAYAVAQFLSGREIDAIYSSPLLRARQTARAIAAMLPNATMHQSTALLEVKTTYQGSPNAIMKPGFSFYDPRNDNSDETMNDVFTRLTRFLRRTVQVHAGRSVVVVSHADPIAILRVGLLDRELAVANLHTTVYPARASVNLLTLRPDHNPVFTYFNVSGERL